MPANSTYVVHSSMGDDLEAGCETFITTPLHLIIGSHRTTQRGNTFEDANRGWVVDYRKTGTYGVINRLVEVLCRIGSHRVGWVRLIATVPIDVQNVGLKASEGYNRGCKDSSRDP